jgi:hypothetical protein
MLNLFRNWSKLAIKLNETKHFYRRSLGLLDTDAGRNLYSFPIDRERERDLKITAYC